MTSTCWDIMFNLQLFAEDFPEIMRFSLFLRGVRKSQDLLLFLFCRNAVQSLFGLQFRFAKKMEHISGHISPKTAARPFPTQS